MSAPQTSAETGAKPAYLGLLNAISLAESRAGAYLEAWAEATDDVALAATLRLVAARERSHGDLFCRRLAELGFALRPKADAEAQKRLARYADPQVSDADKVGPPQLRETDPFVDICRRIEAGEYDPMTGNLLTWYIGEERDSARRLEAAFAAVRARANGAADANGAAAREPSADAQALMACMSAGFARLEKSLEKLAKSLK